MKRMLADHVIPDRLCMQGGAAMHSRVKTITTFGLPESQAGPHSEMETRRIRSAQNFVFIF